MLVAANLITAEELLAMGDIGRCELVRGELIMMSPSSAGHGVITARLTRWIAEFVEEHDLGLTLGAETGFIIESTPDTVRAPDVSVVLKDRVAQVIVRRGFGQGAPDLAVEVLSPDDNKKAMVAKAKLWLQQGAKSAWIVDPQTKTVEVRRLGQKVTVLREKDDLRDEAVLPGFSLPLKRLFKVF
jgi:Uma2 family endonuclease